MKKFARAVVAAARSATVRLGTPSSASSVDRAAVTLASAEKVPAYAGYRAFAAAIVHITGRDLLLGAYFNGGQQLADFVSALGPGTLAQLKTATAGTDTGQALRLLESVAALAR